MFVEIGLGWTWIAVAHILGHATVRTLQFLRAPSMLHDYHQMHSAIGGETLADRQAVWRICFPEARSVVALPVGARPRPSRHDSGSLGDPSADAALQAIRKAGRHGIGRLSPAAGRTAIAMPSPARQGGRLMAWPCDRFSPP